MSAYPIPAPLRSRRARLLAGCALAAAFSSPGFGQAFKATPTVQTPGAAIVNQGTTVDTVRILGRQVVIDWTPSDTATGGGAIDILPNGNELRFQVESPVVPKYTVLNRINPADPNRAIRIDGFVNSMVDVGYGIGDAGIWFYSPGGIIAGATSRFDVGSLVLTANEIQIGDLDGEGLFAGQGTSAVSGTIRFRGAADSRSFVTVEAGAKINAAGNYVALVAPRVTQNGMVTVNGGAAFVAAEQLDMLIPVSGGLFDIQISAGTSVDTPNETVLTHGGTTTGASGEAEIFANRRIHMMAVPKNDAVTMLVSGSVGYAPASQANLVNGDIILSTGLRISPGGGAETPNPPSTIALTGGSFTSGTELRAETIDLNATTADLTFSDDLFASSRLGIIRARADAGRTIQVGDELVLALTEASASSGLSKIELTAVGSGTIKANSIFLGANASGPFDGGNGVPDQAAGSISVLADNGTVQTSSLSVNANAMGGGSNVEGNNAANATGGIITIQAKNAGGAILADVINVAADADGGDAGYGAINGGFGKAGSITFGASGGATITTNALTLSAAASGGDGQVAGIGTGGTLDLDFTNSVVSVADTVSLSASGSGGRAPGSKLGGDGLGGAISLDAAGGSLAFNSISANADGTGRGTFFAVPAELGGTGKGGTIGLAFSGTTLEGANAISASASGVGGRASNSGAGLGGTVSLSVKNGAALTTDTSHNLTADGTGGEGQVSSGLGKGGTVALSVDAATFATGFIGVSVAGKGGDNAIENGTSGDGTGGSISVEALNAGTFSTGVMNLLATGTGGLESGYGAIVGGSGTGGQIAVKAAGDGLIEMTGLTGNAIGSGRFGGISGGAGLGGRVTFEAAGGNISASEGVELFAKGTGGSSTVDGGGATGGKIEIAASAGIIDIDNFTGDASADGGSSFGLGSGAAADGGEIKISALAGGTILGLNFFEASGRGGDGDSDATAGFGKGGSVIVRAADGTIDARGGTLSLVANGVGGNGAPTASLVGDTLLARGGTVDIGVSGSGQLLFSAVQALANGSFFNFSDGFTFPNHGANAVGGTVLLSVADAGLVQGDSVEASISLTANGRGADSAAGGFGGTGYQGRAEVRMEGGLVEAPFLTVTARAEGGLGNDQNEEGGDDAGSGGFAGIGVSPYVGEAGAIIDITGGTLQGSFVSIDGGSTGGAGGEGEEFASFTVAGRGGDAIGGLARFSVTGGSSVDVFGLSISSGGRGGDGGSVEIFDSGSSDGVMGDGGLGAAGFVSVTLGGTGTLAILNVSADASGTGGNGGSFETGYGGFFGGTGRGGIGGLAFGGTVDLKIESGLPNNASVSIEAGGQGGSGGDGPQGGAGGDAQGGTARMTVLGGSTLFNDFDVLANGFGGDGGDGLGGNAGAAGSGKGTIADVVIGAGAQVTTDRMSVSASGFGGFGGQGADDISNGFGGGRGGDATGGNASVTVAGSFTLLGFAEGSPSVISANASGGTGGSGGAASEGTGGTGGNGGDAVGGAASFATVDGTTDLFSLQMRGNGTGGSRGFAGSGIEGIDGNAGAAQAGSVVLSIDQKNAPGNQIRLGFVEMFADGSAEGFSAGKAGSISISAFGGASPLAVEMQSLEITSFGTEDPGDAVGLSFAGTDAAINIGLNADMLISGAVVATGTNSLNASSLLLINSGGNIDLGSTSFGGGDVSIDGFGSSISSNGSIVSANNLSVQAVLGSTTLANLSAGADASVTAADSISIGNATAQNLQAQAGADGSLGGDVQLIGQIDAADQINVQATRDILLDGGADVRGGGGVFLTAGDDIIIGAGALLRSDSGPPPEFGYGGPLLQMRAGFSGLVSEPPVGDIGSIIVDGGIDFGNGTVVFQGDAIAGSLATGSVRAGNLYADLTDIPPNEVTPLDDLGQLSGKCLQGSVCLGTVEVSRILEIGDGSDKPLYLRFNPQTDAFSVFLQAQTIELGQTGVTTSLKASNSLQVEALNGNLALAQGLSITGGAALTRLAATNNISGAADVSNPGNTLDVFAGNHMSFGAVSASAIRTVDFEGTVVNAGGFTAPGKLDIGKVSIGTDISLIGGTGASLGTADLAPTARLELFTKAGLARLGGGTLLDLNVSGNSIDVSVAAGGDVFGTANNGTATLGTVSGALIDAVGSQGIAFSSLSASGLVRLDSQGPITGGSATGGIISVSTPGTLTADALAAADTLDVNATAGISLATTKSGGTTKLLAATGGVSVKTDASAGGGITAEGTGVSLIGKSGLIVTSAKSTAGELILVAGGSTLKVGTADAAGDAILFSGGALTVDTLKATGKADLESALGAVQVTDADVQGGVSASGTSVSLASSSALKVNEAKATSGTLVLTAGGDLSADRIASSGAATLTAAGAVQVLTDAATTGGLTVTGTTVTLAGLNGLIITKATASAGDIKLTNAAGAITVGLAETSNALSIESGGAVTVNDVRAPAGVKATGTAVTLNGSNGLLVQQATATKGDVVLESVAGMLTLGGIEATGDVRATSAADLSFFQLDAGGLLSLVAKGDVNGTAQMQGGSISVETPGRFELLLSGSSTSGPISIAADQGIRASMLVSAGAMSLAATNGAVSVDNTVGPDIVATGKSITLNATGLLDVKQATATAGDVLLGAIVINADAVSASGTVGLFADGSLKAGSLSGNSVTVLANAGDVAFDSVTANAEAGIFAGGIVLGGSVVADSLKLDGKIGASLSGASKVRGDAIVTTDADLTFADGATLSSTEGNVLLTAGGEILGDGALFAGKDLTVTGTQGLALRSALAGGVVELSAPDGAVSVSNDIAGSSVRASGRSVALTGANGLNVQDVTATAGGIALVAQSGSIDVQQAAATAGVSLQAGDGISFGTLVGANGVSLFAANGSIAGDTIETPALSATAGGDISIGQVKTDRNLGEVDIKAAGAILLGQAGGRASLVGDGVELASFNGEELLIDAGSGALKLGLISVDFELRGVGATVTFDTIDYGVQNRLLSLSASSGDVQGKTHRESGLAQFVATKGNVTLDTIETSTGFTGTTELIAGGDATLGGGTANGFVSMISNGGNAELTGPLNAAGGASFSAASAIKLGGPVVSGDDLTIDAGQQVTFTKLVALNDIALDAGANVTGGSATAGAIVINTPGALLADDLVATVRTLEVIATKGVTVDTAVSSGTTTLKADQGTVTVASDIKPGEGLIVSAPSINLTGQTGLNIAEANATAGDLILKTVTGDLIAGKSTATGAISLDSAGALTFASLTAQQGVTLKAAGDVTGDSVTGTSVAVTAGGTKGIALQSIAATGPVTLGATAGAIQIGNLLTSAAIQATARSIGLGSTGNILLTQASATDGDITLKSVTGGITLGQVSASKALAADASAGTLTVTGTASAGTIAFTSADIAIGSGAQVGSVSQTGTVTFTSSAPRTFVGGTGTGTGYRLDATELTRVAARDGFTITALPTQGSTAFSFVEPDQATIVLDSMSFAGAQLGTNGLFTVDAPRSIGIVGNVEYKNFAAGQSVIYRAGTDISLGAETGLVTLKDSAGALAGTLRLQAPQVIAMSVPARAEVPNLTLNQARQRLGTNDAVQNDGGYFQAGNIDVRIGQLLFIQNSGGADGLRGFTGNNVRIEATGSNPAQVVVNGRVQTGSGFADGADLADNLTLVGNFDPDSSFGGCALGASSCGGPPPEVTDLTFSVARDQIRDEEEEDEQEEALQAAQTRPDPVIQFMTPPSSRFDPLIDEPITGAGNEDLWETPTIPSPGN